jgi:tight adherence protein B
MPIGLIGVIKMMSPDFAANFTTMTGVLATTVAIVIFIAAYYVGKAVLDIKV